jgi:hypothetical protein
MKTLYACIFISMPGHHFASAQIGPADSYYVGRVKDIFPGAESNAVGSSSPRDFFVFNGTSLRDMWDYFDKIERSVIIPPILT